MHIDKLIEQAVKALPHITSEEKAQGFLNTLDVSDQMAIISAYYIGIKHLGDNALLPDTDPFNRTLHAPVHTSNYADILYKKRLAFRDSMNAFLRCTSQEQRDNF